MNSLTISKVVDGEKAFHVSKKCSDLLQVIIDAKKELSYLGISMVIKNVKTNKRFGKGFMKR